MPAWWSAPTTKHAFVLAWISVVLEFLFTCAGIAFYLYTGSALCLVFGLENSVDFLSSVVVFWRFYCPGEITKDVEELLMKREKRASIAISIILLLLGVGVIISAADDLSKGPDGDFKLEFLLVMAFFSIFLFGFLTIIKFKYSHALDSASLYKDGLCSVIGTIMATALFVNTLVIKQYPQMWFLDPAVALFCGMIALALGLFAVVEARFFHQLPICSLKWWCLSQGDGMDEIGARKLGPADYGEEESSPSKSSPNKSVEMGHKNGVGNSHSYNGKTDTQLSEVV